MSQQDLANSLGYSSKSTIAKIESLAKEVLKDTDKETIDTSFLDERINSILSYYINTNESLRNDTVFGLTQSELELLPKEFAKLLQNFNENSYKLFVKIDYYNTYIDEESKVQSGVNYIQTLL